MTHCVRQGRIYWNIRESYKISEIRVGTGHVLKNNFQFTSFSNKTRSAYTFSYYTNQMEWIVGSLLSFH